jgi:hypothetical protein
MRKVVLSSSDTSSQSTKNYPLTRSHKMCKMTWSKAPISLLAHSKDTSIVMKLKVSKVLKLLKFTITLLATPLSLPQLCQLYPTRSWHSCFTWYSQHSYSIGFRVWTLCWSCYVSCCLAYWLTNLWCLEEENIYEETQPNPTLPTVILYLMIYI